MSMVLLNNEQAGKVSLYLDHKVLDHCPKDVTAKPQPEGEEAHHLKNLPGREVFQLELRTFKKEPEKDQCGWSEVTGECWCFLLGLFTC